MPPPPQVTQWLQRTYPQPRVDQEWLNDCYNWVREEYHLDPAAQMDQIIQNVDTQLLESDLRDSMVPGTGLPQASPEVKQTIIRGPVLVQVLSIMDIGQSAFSLMNVRQARLERADLAGLAGAEDDEDEGPIPSYPRSMLRLELTDGSVNLPAVEHRRIPELKLGESQLGLKMILKNVPVRRGIAFLDPKCVVIKGHHVADLDAFQDRNFARALRERLRLPHDPALDEPDPQPEPGPQPPAQAPAPPRVRTPERQMNPARVRSPPIRSPLQELPKPSMPLAAGLPGQDHDDDAGQPRRRKLPARVNRTPSPEPPARPPQLDTRSRYFAGAGPGVENPSATLARERLLSPGVRPPLFVPDSDEEEEAARMDWDIAGQPRTRPQPQPQPQPVPVREPANGDGNVNQNENGWSSDFDMGDEDYFNDQAVLELADRVEREELALQSQPQSQSVAVSTAQSATAVQTGQTASTSVSTAGTLVASSSALLGASRSESEPRSSTSRTLYSARSRSQSSRPAARRNMAEAVGDVITIDSDVDEKENIPVLTRRVRRRMRPPPSQNPGDIIELSD